MTDLFPAIVTNLVTRAPLYLVWLAALLVAIARWRAHPRVSLVATISIALLAILMTGSMIIAAWLPFALRGRGMSMAEVARFSLSLSVFVSLLEAVGWAGIVYAIFGARAAAAPK